MIAFTWAAALAGSLILADRRSKQHRRTVHDFAESMATSRRVELARRERLRRWNRRSASVAGEFEA